MKISLKYFLKNAKMYKSHECLIIGILLLIEEVQTFLPILLQAIRGIFNC